MWCNTLTLFDIILLHLFKPENHFLNVLTCRTILKRYKATTGSSLALISWKRHPKEWCSTPTLQKQVCRSTDGRALSIFLSIKWSSAKMSSHKERNKTSQHCSVLTQTRIQSEIRTAFLFCQLLNVNLHLSKNVVIKLPPHVGIRNIENTFFFKEHLNAAF